MVLGRYNLLQPLLYPLERCAFLNDLFDAGYDEDSVSKKDAIGDPFFEYYHKLCYDASNIEDIGSVSHYHITQAVRRLKFSSISRENFVRFLREDIEFCLSFDLSETIADISTSTWLMLSIGKFPGADPYDDHVLWEDGLLYSSGLHPDDQDSVIGRQFPPEFSSKDVVKLPQSFTAANLEKIGGIQIHWTNNLADHLLLRDDDTKLFLFHQVFVLQLHIASYSTPYPKDFLDETLRTIALLIPPVLGGPNSWFEAQLLKGLDSHAGILDRLNSSERQITRFKYWRDRLVLLKRTFDEAEPRTISQLYHDDRKKTQWFTFWVAVLVFVMTIFFGVIQSIASIIQAWASVKALHGQG